jgi:hypothetical protein
MGPDLYNPIMKCQKSSQILSILLSVCVLLSTSVSAAEIDLQDLALPSEVKEIGKASGAVFYSSTNKNKALMPINFWGEVNRSGLHYVPVDTKLIKGLSLAGGASGRGDLEEVSIARSFDGKIKKLEFDLSGGGNTEAHEFVLRPGDTVYIPNDRFYENRSYYTSLVSVLVTILSGIFLYQRIQQVD